MKKIIALFVSFIMIFSLIASMPLIASSNIEPANWNYVDGLGRVENTFGKIPEKRTDHERVVGIFYHTWHTEFAKLRVPVNLTQVVTENPEAAKNVQKNDFWRQKFERFYAPGYFWNEPLFGYYNTVDEYVLRKHAEMLADAGVDFIYIDGTNGSFMWEEGVDKADWNQDDNKKINIFSDDLSAWDSITSYDHYTGSTRDRDCIGYKGVKFDFSFKWSDNMQVEGDIMDFYTNGDVAPGGRVCFRFQNMQDYNGLGLIWIIIIAVGGVILVAGVVVLIIVIKKRKNKNK